MQTFAPLLATLVPLCTPAVGPVQTVVTAAARQTAAQHAQPPLIDIFAWPDGPLAVLKSGSRYLFFGTDGGEHRNGKAGSVTITASGDLANPLGSGHPLDVTIANDYGLNPKYHAYSYIGNGGVYLVPPGQPGAGNLLAVYHAERTTTGYVGFYSLLGMARSIDGGKTWHDLGEIVEANQPYRSNLDGYDIGDSQIAVDPTGTYFYVYFPDWIANGSIVPNTVTTMSVARASISSVLSAAFAEPAQHVPPFEKYYQGEWNQPGINGLSSDLEPGSVGGSPSVTYDAHLKRYVVVADDTQHISYGESPDGVDWTARSIVLTENNALYARAIGTGADPNSMGAQFYIYFTNRPSWNNATVRRFSATCP